MHHPAFEFIRSEPIAALNISLEEYRHPATKARHFHLAADDDNNAFLVAFLTVPQDSTGVAHILEHTSLCGSRRYPVRDPFFMMIRRSLNTFMNAFTSSDWTAYPFASQNKKDFLNLLQVYLDAAFFPRLGALDFAQEGHRIEFETSDDANTPLVYKGVVFNEMKGSMSSPVQMLWKELQTRLFPTITYHHNSGGDPEEIPALTHEQLRAFHAKHYHPSNAVFFTYGDTPAADHQAHFQERVLQHFQFQDMDLRIPDEQRYKTPMNSVVHYALDEPEAAEPEEAEPAKPEESGKDKGKRKKTHIVLGWLLGRNIDQREVMNAHLMSGVLLDNSASPLRHVLETSTLGTAPSPVCGLDSSTREMNFCCGLEGSEPEHAEAVESQILELLEKTARDGVPQEQLESVLHQFELSQREITGDGFPYGLRLIINALTPALHGSDPLNALNLDPLLDALHEDIKNPEFIKGLVRRLLLDNPHRVRLVMAPDKTLSARKAAEEAARLAAVKEVMNDGEKARIIERTKALETRQNTPDDPECLPKVGLEDVPDKIKFPQSEEMKTGEAGNPGTCFAQGTNGMVYQVIMLDLPELESELLELLPLFCECLPEVGVGRKDYLQTQIWQSSVSGGISAHGSVRANVSDTQRTRGMFSLSGKALARNHAALSELMRVTFDSARFDELPRLRELVAQMRAESESSITSRGSALAMSAATSGMNPVGNLAHHWNGLEGIKKLKALDDSLKDAKALAGFAAKLKRIREILIQAPPQFLLINEAVHQADIARVLDACWKDRPPADANIPLLVLPPVSHAVKQGWTTSTQVNFCAKAYPAVPYSHADAPVLIVLGEFLRNGYLHRAIREQGGAYGGGAGYDFDTGSFRFYSYRDPRLSETLADFDRSLAWVQETRHEPRALEEAVLSVISRIDRPGSPAGEAKNTFFGCLHGRTPEERRRFRSRVLRVSLNDLQRVSAAYLTPERAGVAVLSDTKTLEAQAADLGLEIFVL
ncbi:MAG: peptidase M16 [Gammaproteobacteria bacterium]|nr:peptidase M16 [Gammaproteobacteria bacterium]